MKFFRRNKESLKQTSVTNHCIMDLDKHDVMKAITTLSIEKVLLDIGKPMLDKVTNDLQKQYKSYIPDCYEHPEYLESVLKSIFGNSYDKIVDSIKTELQEYSYDQGIQTLIKTIGR